MGHVTINKEVIAPLITQVHVQSNKRKKGDILMGVQV